MAESLRDYGVSVPHGPNMNAEHVATESYRPMNPSEMNANEKAIFTHLIYPDDSYNEQGTYWADMGILKRMGFTSKIDNQETMKELKQVGRMMRADPLSPIGWYMRNAVIPGAGLLLEGYVLFSIGNVTPLLQAAFPACWGSTKVNGKCNVLWLDALTYLEVVGIICGQVMVGIIGDWIGRRWGLIQDAVIMFIGLLMLIASWGVTQNGWIICYAWSLWFYSVGVGGEYPMTATSAMENAVGAGKISTREDRLHRGRKVTMAFLMQGWGQVLNQGVLIILLLIFHSGKGGPPYDEKVAQWVYRVSFVPPAIGTLWLCYYRTWKMKSAGKQLALSKKKSSVTGYDVKSLGLTFSFFGLRVFATAGAWFANDVFFYGNKLFQSSFIKALDPTDKSVMTGWLWNLCNSFVALAGYYLASFLVDNKIYGRKWMMIVGFLGDFICFVIPAFNYNYYSKMAPHKFQAMYFLSSFFNQFGPNSVTFLVAAEVYPTAVRATAHGFSAAWGKMGALLAAILYNYIDTPLRFLVVPWFGLAGALITFVFMPDTTGLDLKEGERRWNYIRAGREHEYHGIAVHPHHLSLYERLRGVGKDYNPELDYQQKVAEMRGEWEDAQIRKNEEMEGGHFDDDEFDSDVSSYFQRTGSMTDEKVGNGVH